MPRSQFNGQTPDEVYYGTARNLEGELAARRKKARAARVTTNRKLSCSGWEELSKPDSLAEEAA